MSTPKDKQPHPATMLSVDFDECNEVVGLIDAAFRGLGIQAKRLDPLLEKFNNHGVKLQMAGLGPKEKAKNPAPKKRATKKRAPLKPVK